MNSVKVKVIPRRKGYESPEGDCGYRWTLSLASGLDVGGWSKPRPGRFTPGKGTRYTLYRKLVGFQIGSEQVRKIVSSPGFDPLTVQPVTNRYIN
jgi:hypothetical protein